MNTTATALALIALIGAGAGMSTADAQHYGPGYRDPGHRVGPGHGRGGGMSEIWSDGDFNIRFGGRGRGYAGGDRYGRAGGYGYGRGYGGPGYGYEYEYEYQYGAPYGYGAPSRYAPPPGYGYGYGAYPPAAPLPRRAR
ncbi:MAG: sulfur globule protein CV1 [Chromatiales bacterium]|jgi:hypothetical protein